ncbi:hypothetical protein [Moorena sp. SIO4E2]|nr:hypothetical protein [Moorena sp. SIO4E2]
MPVLLPVSISVEWASCPPDYLWTLARCQFYSLMPVLQLDASSTA